MSVSYRAAWVPDDDPERSWDVASALAADWIDAEAAAQGTAAILITNTYSIATAGSPLGHYVRGQSHFTPKSARPPRGVPVLSYVPTLEALAFAVGLAHDTSVCVVESQAEPLAGWAAGVGATNLLTGLVTPPHPPALARQLERLAFYGNNGFGDPFGKKQARQILLGLRGDGLLGRDVITSGLAAEGVSPRGQRHIQELIDGIVGE